MFNELPGDSRCLFLRNSLFGSFQPKQWMIVFQSICICFSSKFLNIWQLKHLFLPMNVYVPREIPARKLKSSPSPLFWHGKLISSYQLWLLLIYYRALSQENHESSDFLTRFHFHWHPYSSSGFSKAGAGKKKKLLQPSPISNPKQKGSPKTCSCACSRFQVAKAQGGKTAGLLQSVNVNYKIVSKLKLKFPSCKKSTAVPYNWRKRFEEDCLSTSPDLLATI